MLDDETLKIYIEESQEHLADIEKDLLTIEEMGEDIDDNLVNKVFRAAHSIKGGASFMGLDTIKELSHKLENVLGLIRERELVPSPNLVSVLLTNFDKLSELLQNVDESNNIDISEQVASLQNVTVAKEDSKKTLSNKEFSTQLQQVIKLPNSPTTVEILKSDIEIARKTGKYVYILEYDLIHDIHYKNKQTFDILKLLQQSGVIIDSRLDMPAVGTLETDDFQNRIPFFVFYASDFEPDSISDLTGLKQEFVHFTPELNTGVNQNFQSSKTSQSESSQDIEQESTGEESTGEESTGEESTGEDIETQKLESQKLESQKVETQKTTQESKKQSKKPEQAKTDDSDFKETNIRVNINLLDSLMNLAGELVLSRNQLVRSISSDDRRALEMAKQRIDMVTSELQEAIMLTRMQPIGKIFNKFPRVVRDMASNMGKEIKLDIEGKEVELDKSILEGLNDPLTHMVRNSVDHGIETPTIRNAAGKPEAGHITLRAYHEAGHIIIEIVDDGKGIDGDKLLQKAISLQMITEEQAKAITEKEKINLIFLAGLSTAEKVTDVSGRGVGMDVVKSNLDRMGGLIDVTSAVGEGTSIRIKLPLTLAIIPSLLVSVGSERYAIPQVNLDELLRIPATQVKQRIEIVGSARVVRLRETLLPIISLAEILGIKSDSVDGAVNIAVVSTGNFQYGLIVDALHNSEEIVVKPLGRNLTKCKEYAGATILGDGRVALILDVANLAHRAELENIESTIDAESDTKDEIKDIVDKESFLIFRSSREEQFGVPLNLVARIERIKSAEMEVVGQRKVIQYMGGTIPLFALHEVAAVKPLEDQNRYIVLVFKISGKEFGLLCTYPIDSVEVQVKIDERVFKQPGILGSMVVGKHTTLIVDIYGFIKTIQPQWIDKGDSKQDNAITILLAEDMAFFRNQMQQMFMDEGFNVLVSEDGEEAWKVLEEHQEEISIVVTDIEMPRKDGLALTRDIKKDPRFSHLPVIAVTSLSGEQHMLAGLKAGVDEYQVKLDKDRLMESIYKYCKVKSD